MVLHSSWHQSTKTKCVIFHLLSFKAWALWVAYIGILELVWFVGVFLYSFEIESAIKLSGAIGTFIIVKVKSLLCLFDWFTKQLGARGLMSTPNLNRWIKYYGYFIVTSTVYTLGTPLVRNHFAVLSETWDLWMPLGT